MTRTKMNPWLPGRPSPADERRRARQAQIEAEQEHGRPARRALWPRGSRPRFAALGHADAKRIVGRNEALVSFRVP